MKKTTLILSLLISAFGFAQNVSTGVVEFTSDFSVKFDVNGTTNKVTMTMVGPANVWLAVALNKSYTPNSGMGIGGEDVIIFHEVNNVGQIADRYLTGNGAPTSDGSINQDWSITSNDIAGSVRTIIATRDRDTNDPNDYDFPTTNTALPMLWAKGNLVTTGLVLGYHGARSGVSSTLGTETIAALPEFNVYPNPTLRELNVKFPSSIQKAQVAVYSVLGSLVFQAELDQFNSKINTSEWNSGVYIMNISTSGFSETKRIIKQ
tara:strand:+ start:4363 stop:5151 length:789 start_codon:yes stop_codon:yes gene_type:complete